MSAGTQGVVIFLYLVVVRHAPVVLHAVAVIDELAPLGLGLLIAAFIISNMCRILNYFDARLLAVDLDARVCVEE